MSSQDAPYFMLEGPSGKREVSSFKLHDWAFSKFYYLELSMISSGLLHQLNEQLCLRFDDCYFHAVVQSIQKSTSQDKVYFQLISPIAAALQGCHSRVYSQLNKRQLLTHFLQDNGLKKGIDFQLTLEADDTPFFFHQDNEIDLDFFYRLMNAWGLIFYEQQQPTGTCLLISDSLDNMPVAEKKQIIENSPKGMSLSEAISDIQTEKMLGRATLETQRYSAEKSSLIKAQYRSAFEFCTGSMTVDGDDFYSNSIQWQQSRDDESLCTLYFQSTAAYTPGQPVTYSAKGCFEESFRVRTVVIEGLQEPLRGLNDLTTQNFFHKSRLCYHLYLTQEFYPVAALSHQAFQSHGLQTALVESRQAEYADLQEQGGYAIRLLADQKNQQIPQGYQNSKTMASLRQGSALYYAGANYGLSFPLHEKTEVISQSFHAAGQQRGLIGCLANKFAPSVVNSHNSELQLIRTHQGAELVFASDERNKSFSLSSASSAHQLSFSQGDENQIKLLAKKGDINIASLKKLHLNSGSQLAIESQKEQCHWVSESIHLSSQQGDFSFQAEEGMSLNWHDGYLFYAQNQFWKTKGKIQFAIKDEMRFSAVEQLRFSAQQGRQLWQIKQGPFRFVINKHLLLKVKETFISFSPSEIKISSPGVFTLDAGQIEGMG